VNVNGSVSETPTPLIVAVAVLDVSFPSRPEAEYEQVDEPAAAIVNPLVKSASPVHDEITPTVPSFNTSANDTVIAAEGCGFATVIDPDTPNAESTTVSFTVTVQVVEPAEPPKNPVNAVGVADFSTSHVWVSVYEPAAVLETTGA
jgi:hypothetical protein